MWVRYSTTIAPLLLLCCVMKSGMMMMMMGTDNGSIRVLSLKMLHLPPATRRLTDTGTGVDQHFSPPLAR